MIAIAYNVIANLVTDPLKNHWQASATVLEWSGLPYLSFFALLGLWAAVYYYLRERPIRQPNNPTPATSQHREAIVVPPTLSVDPIQADGFVHIRVANPGPPDTFIAQIDTFIVQEQQKLYSVKWRGADSEEKRVYKDDLLDLAQPIVPREELTEDGGTDFVRGSFNLYSPTVPQGWNVHALPGLRQNPATVPPDERWLLLFDDVISLHLRVIGTKKQTAQGWINLGFQRPAFDYNRKVWIHKRPVAEMHPTICGRMPSRPARR